MNYKLIGQPCRNFQILGIAKFIDPKDDKEKVVLSNFAAGAIGNIIIIDPETGEGEPIMLPGDNGAWAVLNYKNEKLFIGTCGHYGYLHCLDLLSREWAPPLCDEKEQYIWNLCLGSDGMIYGGTWPGCVLLRYDPVKGKNVLENMGRVSENKDNMYSRLVYGEIPGHILIACGSAESHLALWSMDTHTVRRFGKTGASVKEITDQFICTQANGELDFYDIRTFEPIHQDLSGKLSPPNKPPKYAGMSFSIKLNDGKVLATRGQEYYIDIEGEDRPELKPIPAPRPATHILTITSDSKGNIWGSSGFGQTIFRYDPASGEAWNTQVVCDRGGEAYGMAFTNGKLFLATYSGGDHIVYDPEQPWDQINNLNPKTLEQVGPMLIRPAAKSVIGPDGNFWAGWMAQYGTYGGGLSRVDVNTLEMTSWLDPIPNQTLVSLTADKTYLYFITGGQANGLPSKEGPFHFVVWSTNGKILWQKEFEKSSILRCVTAVHGRVLVAVDNRIEIFRPAALSFERSIEMDTPTPYITTLSENRAAAFCGNKLWTIDPLTGDISYLGDLPGQVYTATVTPKGDVYFAFETQLYKLEL